MESSLNLWYHRAVKYRHASNNINICIHIQLKYLKIDLSAYLFFNIANFILIHNLHAQTMQSHQKLKLCGHYTYLLFTFRINNIYKTQCTLGTLKASCNAHLKLGFKIDSKLNSITSIAWATCLTWNILKSSLKGHMKLF